MKKWKKAVLAAAGIVLIVAVTAAATWLLTNRAWTQRLDKLPPSAKKAMEVESYLERYFIDEYDESALADGAASGIVSATGDRWSYYLSAEEAKEHQLAVENVYAGIGVTIRENQQLGGMQVLEVVEDGPADRAGVQVDDIIVEAEGKSTIELGMDGTQETIAGEIGTEVRIVVLRGAQRIAMTMLRAAIESPVAECRMLPGSVGYILIANFDSRCAQETNACIDKMLMAGAKGLIFDVRFNPGGYVDELVGVLDKLLPEGELFRCVDYAGTEERELSDAACLPIPMAVLVNSESYSAAEFFAAALQEYEWAQIVGEKTCGKGNFQYGFDLSDGSLLNISAGKYFTPQGRSLTDVGVTPDIEQTLSEEEMARLYYGVLEDEDDAQLQAALEAVCQKIS